MSCSVSCCSRLGVRRRRSVSSHAPSRSRRNARCRSWAWAAPQRRPGTARPPPRRTARCGRSGIAPTPAFPGSRKRLALSGRRSEPLRLDDFYRPSAGDRPTERLTSSRWPAHLDRGRVIRRSETEVEGQVALGEVTRLPIHRFENTSAVGEHHSDLRAQPFAVRPRPAYPDLEEVDGVSLGEVAEEYLRPRVELVGDDVQVAVPVQVEQDRGAAGARGHHRQLPSGVKPTPRFDPARLLARGAEELPAVRSVAVEGEPDLIRDTVRAWLHAEDEFAGKETPPAFVQEDGVDPVAMREVH